jgi:hypothetical protein
MVHQVPGVAGAAEELEELRQNANRPPNASADETTDNNATTPTHERRIPAMDAISWKGVDGTLIR